MCQSPGWRGMTSSSATTVFNWSPTLGFPHIPRSVSEGQLLPKAQKTHPYLLKIHLWKLHSSTNPNEVSLHLRSTFLISQPYASFHQDLGPLSPEHCYQLCDVSFKRTQRMHSSNFSCSRNAFFLHQAIDGNTEDLFR